MTLGVTLLGRALLAACVGVCCSANAAETWLEKLLRVSGLAAAPGQLRGEDDAESGSLWVADLAAAAPLRWTAEGGYRSPVFSVADMGLFALQNERVVSLARPAAALQLLHRVPGVLKLVGVDPQAAGELIVLRDDSSAPLATLSLRSGALQPLAFDRNAPQAQALLGQIRSHDRSNGSVHVSVQTHRQQGLSRVQEWTEVSVRQGPGEVRRVSRGDGVNCSQPALSPDGRRVAFVMAEA